MGSESVFRATMALSFVAMLGIRVHYQSRVLLGGLKSQVREGSASLAAGSVAALTTLVFGAEYIVARGAFHFAYLVRYPVWLRGVGVGTLTLGILLLWMAQHHLGLNFHSLVVVKDEQVLVESGPYRLIRHPIYTAYLASYFGGGLTSSDWVLTVAPVLSFSVLVALRMGREEAAMVERFGSPYSEYMQRTGRLIPRLRRPRSR